MMKIKEYLERDSEAKGLMVRNDDLRQWQAELEAARAENAIQARMIEAMAAAMDLHLCPKSECNSMNVVCAECIKTHYREQAEKKESEK